MSAAASYVRFQGTTRSPRGHFPGVFALANGLAREGKLSDEQYRFWRASTTIGTTPTIPIRHTPTPASTTPT